MEGSALCRPKSVRDRCTINLYIGIPLLIIVAIIQSSLLPQVPVFGLVPNLMLLTIVAWSFQRGPNEGIVWGLIGGLAIDLASGALVGISPLPLMVAALVAGIGRTRIFSGNVVLPALVAKNISREIRPMLYLAPCVALAASVLGFVLAHAFDVPPAHASVMLLCLALLAAWVTRHARG